MLAKHACTHARTHAHPIDAVCIKVDKPENGDPNIYISDVDDAGAAREAGMSNPILRNLPQSSMQLSRQDVLIGWWWLGCSTSSVPPFSLSLSLSLSLTQSL